MARPPHCLARIAFAILLLVAADGPACAQQCAGCGENISTEFIWMSGPELPGKQAICKACSALETVCWTCRLPVKRDPLKLDDGRLLCALHARDAVRTQQEADDLFREVKRDMIRLLRGFGTTPDRSITLSLVDAPQMAQLAGSLHGAESHSKVLGLTHSQRSGDTFTHSIYLLSGQGRARLTATGAHEYTHAWMKENVPSDRRLDTNTVEGFCELAAYRLMSEQNQELEKRVILTNAYTRGQIDTFVKAEDSLQFYRIVEWIKSGSEDRLESSNTAGVLALKPQPVVLPGWSPTVPTKVPDTLQLKGISGRTGQRLALVNDLTLAAGETGRVRVGSTKLTVRCLSVATNSAVLELVDSGERLELSLRAP